MSPLQRTAEHSPGLSRSGEAVTLHSSVHELRGRTQLFPRPGSLGGTTQRQPSVQSASSAQRRLQQVRVQDRLTELASRGRFEAMLRDLAELPLLEATRLVADKQVLIVALDCYTLC